VQIADHLMHEGSSQGRGDLQEDPQDQAGRGAVQLQPRRDLGEAGLLADAKAYFIGVAPSGAPRGDRPAPTRSIVRLGSLDPSDFDARALAAPRSRRTATRIAAAMQYRSMHADLLEKGRDPRRSRRCGSGPANPDDATARESRARRSRGDLDARSTRSRRSPASDPAC
jgi:hypothetical protein